MCLPLHPSICWSQASGPVGLGCDGGFGMVAGSLRVFSRVLGSKFHRLTVRKRLVPLVTSLVRTSSARWTQEMQGGDQPATGMEPDLGWVSCSWVSGFSQGGNPCSLWKASQGSLCLRVCCTAEAEEPWRSMQRGCSPGICWAAAGHRCPSRADIAGEGCSPGATGASLPG